jgi:hypothetical protein
VTGGAARPALQLGPWLREQRRLRAWDVPQLARQLARAAGGDRHTLPSQECLLVYIRRWERGTVGVSERYTLLYCKAFGIEPGQFGPAGWAPASSGNKPAATALTTTPDSPPLTGALREICDTFRDAAKSCQLRAEQLAEPALAALCRGQVLAYTAAADNLDAVLANRET